jgi:serine/threonine protein kinase
MSFLIPPSDQCVNPAFAIVDEDGVGEVYASREEFLSTDEGSTVHHESVLMMKHYDFTVYQKYIVNTKTDTEAHYRPIVCDLAEYLEGTVPSDVIKKGKGYTTREQIGSGNYGDVVRYGDSSIVVKESEGSPDEDMHYVMEYTIMKYLKLDWVLDIQIVNNELHIYMKRMSGDMLDWTNDPRFVPEKKRIFFELCKSMYHAHSMGVVHLDLKWENILMDKHTLTPHIADWGISKFLPYTSWIGHKCDVATSSYRPPEVWMQIPYEYPPVDIFSLGIIGVELLRQIPHFLCEMRPFKYLHVYSIGVKPEECQTFADYMMILYPTLEKFDDLLTKKFDILPQRNTEIPYDLLNGMLCNLPSQRTPLHEVLNHPFFSDLRGDVVYTPITPQSILEKIPALQTPVLSKEVLNRAKTFDSPMSGPLVCALPEGDVNVLCTVSSILLNYYYLDKNHQPPEQVFEYLKSIDFNILGTFPKCFFIDTTSVQCQMMCRYALSSNLLPPNVVAAYIAQTTKSFSTITNEYIRSEYPDISKYFPENPLVDDIAVGWSWNVTTSCSYYESETGGKCCGYYEETADGEYTRIMTCDDGHFYGSGFIVNKNSFSHGTFDKSKLVDGTVVYRSGTIEYKGSLVGIKDFPKKFPVESYDKLKREKAQEYITLLNTRGKVI